MAAEFSMGRVRREAVADTLRADSTLGISEACQQVGFSCAKLARKYGVCMADVIRSGTVNIRTTAGPVPQRPDAFEAYLACRPACTRPEPLRDISPADVVPVITQRVRKGETFLNVLQTIGVAGEQLSHRDIRTEWANAPMDVLNCTTTRIRDGLDADTAANECFEQFCGPAGISFGSLSPVGAVILGALGIGAVFAFTRRGQS